MRARHGISAQDRRLLPIFRAIRERQETLK
jgi:hypothetical protein